MTRSRSPLLRRYLLAVGTLLFGQGVVSLLVRVAGHDPHATSRLLSDPAHATIHVIWGAALLAVLALRAGETVDAWAAVAFGVFYLGLLLLGLAVHHPFGLMIDGKENAFHDAAAQWQLSPVALHYIGGLLRHARGMCAITNPLVNSYKRLVPGYEAPVNVAWSMRNRSPLIRVPERRALGTRIELRMPDPAANPYLALAVMLASGLDGIETQADYREPVNENIWEMSFRERRRLRIDDLPHDLAEALTELEKDDVITGALGEHITRHFVEAKRQEWREYISQVSRWELENYLAKY